MIVPSESFNNEMQPSYFAHDHSLSGVAASEESDICHGNARTEPDHWHFTCSEEIAFCPAEIAHFLSGAYFVICWQELLDNSINHNSNGESGSKKIQ